MKEIPLTCGKVALVDDADFEALNQHKWHVMKTSTGRFYAVRNPSRKLGKRKAIRMHVVITGEMHTDHQDNDGLNNQRHNLRSATRVQNAMNKAKRFTTRSTSIYKGVSKSQASNRTIKCWVAQIAINGRNTSLGCYSTDVEAAKAYDTAARAQYGEFAFLNFPHEGI